MPRLTIHTIPWSTLDNHTHLAKPIPWLTIHPPPHLSRAPCTLLIFILFLRLLKLRFVPTIFWCWSSARCHGKLSLLKQVQIHFPMYTKTPTWHVDTHTKFAISSSQSLRCLSSRLLKKLPYFPASRNQGKLCSDKERLCSVFFGCWPTAHFLLVYSHTCV